MHYYGHQKVDRVVKNGDEIVVTTKSGNVYYFFGCKPRIVYVQPFFIHLNFNVNNKGIIKLLEDITKSPA